MEESVDGIKGLYGHLARMDQEIQALRTSVPTQEDCKTMQGMKGDLKWCVQEIQKLTGKEQEKVQETRNDDKDTTIHNNTRTQEAKTHGSIRAQEVRIHGQTGMDTGTRGARITTPKCSEP